MAYCLSWDDRYRRFPLPTEPSAVLVTFSACLPTKGLALDLACGGGRNSIFLAEQGLRVVGIDRSWEALQQGRELARRHPCSVSWVQADLETFPLPGNEFDVVTCFYYRDPRLYPPVGRALRPGGLLFYETFTAEQLRFNAGPRNPAHLLEPGELLTAFGDWEVIFYHERWLERGIAALVARKPLNQ